MTYSMIGGNNKLDQILADKARELLALKMNTSYDEIKKTALELKRTNIRSFEAALKNGTNIALIAEIKKASPSEGDINTLISVTEQAVQYEKAGASVISVLTDARFKGELSFIKEIRALVTVPILRKDFIFDPYQVYESYCAGADAILLMATILDQKTLSELVGLTHELGMECLLETHTEEDMEKALNTDAPVIGINARDLRTFEVDLKNIAALAKSMQPNERFLIAESGIYNRDDVELVAKAGCKAVLVGTTLMRAPDVFEKIKELTSVPRSRP